MGYQSELERLVGAKEAMRQSIINKGVDVPESAKLAEYPEYVAEISDGSGIFEPDLSQPLDQEQLENLQKIVAAGKASEYLKLGDELLTTFDTYTMPFEVVGFEDVVVQENGEDKTVHAINLLAKYTNGFNNSWGANGSTKYSASALRAGFNGGYTSNLNDDFLACLANTKVQTYSRDGTTDIVYDKLYAPSMAELGITDTTYNTDQQAAVEGSAFTAYQNSTATVRIKQGVNATTVAQKYWTRSLVATNANQFGVINVAGVTTYGNYNNSNHLVAACNLIGKQ